MISLFNKIEFNFRESNFLYGLEATQSFSLLSKNSFFDNPVINLIKEKKRIIF